jgi:hypothetical protein
MMYARIAIVLAILGAFAWTYHEGHASGEYAVQAKWDAEAKKQRQIAAKQEADAREKEKLQNETTRKLQTKYSQAHSDLDIALGRLRDVRLCNLGTVPREDGMRVAGGAEGPVPGDPKSATGIAATPAPGASVTLGDALKDTLQCAALIEWVKAQGLAQ